MFKGPEGTPINSTELRRIKVDIRRNIPIKGPIPEIKRDIRNPDDVIISRRDGKLLHLFDSLYFFLQKLDLTFSSATKEEVNCHA